MLDNRTIRLVSGASLIFTAPEGQWTKIFGQLNILSDSEDLCETIVSHTFTLETASSAHILLQVQYLYE